QLVHSAYWSILNKGVNTRETIDVREIELSRLAEVDRRYQVTRKRAVIDSNVLAKARRVTNVACTSWTIEVCEADGRRSTRRSEAQKQTNDQVKNSRCCSITVSLAHLFLQVSQIRLVRIFPGGAKDEPRRCNSVLRSFREIREDKFD